ncbi:MAG: hypothetical protein WC382_09260 [Methanoregulaceae archaeon]
MKIPQDIPHVSLVREKGLRNRTDIAGILHAQSAHPQTVAISPPKISFAPPLPMILFEYVPMITRSFEHGSSGRVVRNTEMEIERIPRVIAIPVVAGCNFAA